MIAFQPISDTPVFAETSVSETGRSKTLRSRTPEINSTGQRPVNPSPLEHKPCKGDIKAIRDFALSGLEVSGGVFVGRCPTLMMEGFQPSSETLVFADTSKSIDTANKEDNL